MLNRRKEPAPKGQNHTGRVLIAFGVFINLYMLLSFFFGEMGLLNASKVRRVYAQVQTEIQSLQLENTRLSKQIEALKFDSKTIERHAREQLGLVKEGELVFEFFETESY